MNRKQRRAQAKAERRQRKVLPLTRRVHPSALKATGELRHPPDPAWTPHIDRLKSVFDEQYPKTVEEWQRGFQQDLHPEREIAIWLRMAEAYEALLSRRRYRRAERRDLFDMVLSLSVGVPPREILAKLKALPADEAEDLLRSLGR